MGLKKIKNGHFSGPKDELIGSGLSFFPAVDSQNRGRN